MKQVMSVYGEVQGVLFRQSAKEKADELGIAGFIENRPDGSVYIEAEGAQEKLEQFLLWCKKGPDSAKVERVEIKEKDEGGAAGFLMR